MADNNLHILKSLSQGDEKNIFKGMFSGAGGFIGKGFGFVKDVFVKGANGTATLVGMTVGKTPIIVGAALTAGAGIALWMNGKNKEKARDSLETLRAGQLQSTQADIMALQQQNAAMMMQPAVGGNTLMGLAPVAGDHANRVLAARGGNMGVDVSNPNMTAANFDAARS